MIQIQPEFRCAINANQSKPVNSEALTAFMAELSLKITENNTKRLEGAAPAHDNYSRGGFSAKWDQDIDDEEDFEGLEMPDLTLRR